MLANPHTMLERLDTSMRGKSKDCTFGQHRAPALTLLTGLIDISASGSGGLKLDVDEKAKLYTHNKNTSLSQPGPTLARTHLKKGSHRRWSIHLLQAFQNLWAVVEYFACTCLGGGSGPLRVRQGGLGGLGRGCGGMDGHAAAVEQVLQEIHDPGPAASLLNDS